MLSVRDWKAQMSARIKLLDAAERIMAHLRHRLTIDHTGVMECMKAAGLRVPYASDSLMDIQMELEDIRKHTPVKLMSVDETVDVIDWMLKDLQYGYNPDIHMKQKKLRMEALRTARNVLQERLECESRTKRGNEMVGTDVEEKANEQETATLSGEDAGSVGKERDHAG